MSEQKIPIPAMLYNAAVGGHVTNSQQIIDENLNKEQSQINQETDTFIKSKGNANGVATLDGSGKVPESQLPDMSSDIIEGYYYGTEDPDTHEIVYDFYTDIEHTQKITPSSDKIYFDKSTNVGYHWTGNEYSPVGNPDVYTKNEIDDMIDDTLHLSQQVLTNTQKEQVRDNIGLNNVINVAIASEASQRAVADSSLQSNITSETSRAQTAEQRLQEQYNALTQSDIIVGTLPSSGTKNKIYRVPGTTSYSDYMWNGSSFVKMATYDNAIDDDPTVESDNLVKSGGVAKIGSPERKVYNKQFTSDAYQSLGGLVLKQGHLYKINADFKNWNAHTSLSIYSSVGGTEYHLKTFTGTLSETFNFVPVVDCKAIRIDCSDLGSSANGVISINEHTDTSNYTYCGFLSKEINGDNWFNFPSKLEKGQTYYIKLNFPNWGLYTNFSVYSGLRFHDSTEYKLITGYNVVKEFVFTPQEDCYSFRVDCSGTPTSPGQINIDTTYPLATKKDIESLNDIPSFVHDEAIITYNRIMAWANDKNISMLGQVTDIHGYTDAIKYLHEIDTLYGFTVLMNGGDLAPEQSSSDSAAISLMNDIIGNQKHTSKWLYCKGNHDYRSNVITSSTLNNIMNSSYASKYNYDCTQGGYGFVDDICNKVRYIYLSTSEGNTNAYTMSVEQVQYVIDKLQKCENNYKIVVLGHLCIDEIGRWNSYPTDADASCFVALRDILADFVAKSSGSNAALDISWDFTAVDTSIKLVCYLAGDSHFDNYIKRDGVNYIVRQGYGGISSSEITHDGISTSFDRKEQCLFDVLCIKSDGNAGVFRIGAGGSSRDLAFTY